MTGTAIAQAIPVAVSPILTRLYSPADLGALALYLAIVTIGAVVATGRYELAILLPSDDDEAFDLLAAASLLALAVCTILSLALVLGGGALLPQRISATLGGWIHLVPLGILLTALNQSLGYWLNRHSRYRRLVSSRVAQSGVMCSTQAVAGVARTGAPGLLVGYVAGQLAGGAVLLRRLWTADGSRLSGLRLPRLLAHARIHRRFPTYLVPGHVANATSAHMPVLMLTLLFGPAVAGFYSLAERVLVLPTSVIGSAVGDVYRQRAAELYNRVGNCRALFLSSVRRLALMGLLPCLIVVAFGPSLFAVVFGGYWRESGSIAAIVAGMVYFQIVSSPLSQTVYLANMHRADLVWQIARLVLSAASIYVGFVRTGDPRTAIACYAVAFALLHIAHSIMQYRAACGVASGDQRSVDH